MAVDYYQILQIPPSADPAEIKAAYRKLAHQFHPDKNPENKTALARFELIKEAYETLSHPGRKEKYLQERWLSSARGQPLEQPVKTPEDILREVLAAGDRVHQMDIYRLNKEGLEENLGQFLAEESIALLNEFNELSINDVIIKELIQIIAILPTQRQEPFLSLLKQINSRCSDIIQQRMETLAGKIFWETWKPAFIILLVVLICILIWGTSLKY